jgi:hypothetical protein
MAAQSHHDLGGALPLATPPALVADLCVLSAAGLLSAIHERKRSGLALFRYRDQEKQVFLEAGEVIFASSNQTVDRLGECLLRTGAIKLADLEQAEREFKPGDRFGRVLVERGILTPRELWNGVRGQVEEIVRSLFSVPDGRMWFWDGEIRPDNVVRLSLETSRLILEGQQRCAELRRFLAVLDDPRVQLAQTNGSSRPSLAGSERAIFAAVGAGRAFRDVVAELRLDPESAARSVQLLRLVGALKLMRTSEVPPAAPTSAALRARVEAFAKLVDTIRGAIAQAEGDRAIDARLTRQLNELATRFPALLADLSLTASGGIDVEQWAERASRLPDSAEEVVTAVLSEIVTYLEFELVNHPKLKDAEGFLAGLGPLRRAISD